MLGSIFGWIGSGIIKVLGNSVLAPILQTIQNGQNANKDVAVQLVQAEMSANAAKAAIAPSFKPLIYLTAIPAIAHWAAIMADSFPWPGHAVGSWGIGALPEAYRTIEGTILLAPFISSPLTTLARAGAAALIKR